MPSNKDLIKEANTLAAELKLEIVTDGLNNVKLSALVSDLKAKHRDAGLDTQADEAPAVAPAPAVVAPAAAPAVVVAEPFPFTVAPGKALTTKRGVLGEGEEILIEDVTGGVETLRSLVKSKYVIKA